jgi:outer membrane protein OmpA-like peptidoglycan-associated protein
MMYQKFYLIFCIALLWGFSATAQDFKVQAAAFNSPMSIEFFKDRGVNQVIADRDQQGVYHYYVGAYVTRSEAEAVQQQLIDKGFGAATIIDREEQRALDNSRCPYVTGYHGVYGYRGRKAGKSTIYFDSGKADLSAEAKTELDRLANLIKTNAKVKLNIFGHTDSDGGGGNNMELATARARNARNYLMEKGVNAERIFLRVVGEADPAIDTYDLNNDSERAAAQRWNRRVDLVVVE